MKWFPETFRSRLALAIGAMALGVGLPFYLYVTHIYGQQLVREREQALHELAESVASVVSLNLGERLREIGLVARMAPGLAGPQTDAAEAATLNALQAAYPVYAWIGATDTQGVVRVATGGLLEGQAVAQRPWFAGGLRGPYLGDRHRAELLQSLLAPASPNPLYFIDVAVPITAPDGRVTGVLAAHLYWRWAAHMVASIVPGKSARQQIDVFLVDQKGHISYPDRVPGATQVPAALSLGAPQVLDSWAEGGRYLSVALPVPEAWPASPLGWRVVVRQPLDVALGDLIELQRVVLVVTVLASLAFLLLAWWGARVISRPLEVLTGLALRVEQGEEDVQLDPGARSAEVRALSAALKGMAGTLIARRQALERSNHELEDKVAERTAELARSNEALERLARHDTLTGLPNRRACDERLLLEFERMRRSGLVYAVMVLDIDHFKQVNDGHGHAAGDQVLRHVADLLRGQLRSTDFVGRSGGEEFLVLLPQTPPDEALRVAQKLRHGVDTSDAPVVGHVTLSIGVSMGEPGQGDPEMAVRLADDQLYRAKQNGRNRVESSFMR
jgi:diguanylate cyclase (GGDEF)-like protein